MMLYRFPISSEWKALNGRTQGLYPTISKDEEANSQKSLSKFPADRENPMVEVKDRSLYAEDGWVVEHFPCNDALHSFINF